MAKPFVANDASTVTISATSSTSTTALTSPAKGLFQVRLYNAGTKVVFVRFGTSGSVVAAITDIPIPPGALEVMSLEGNTSAPITHIAAICAATETTTLYVTTGIGI